jgi:predicted RNA-binding Zn-ribbon protein involved in translation (DUF1610 family)
MRHYVRRLAAGPKDEGEEVTSEASGRPTLDKRSCCGCQSLVKDSPGVWFRCARGLLRLDVDALMRTKGVSGSTGTTETSKRDERGNLWIHREVVQFEMDSPCPYRYETSPEAVVGGVEDVPASEEQQIESVAAVEGTLSKNQIRYARRNAAVEAAIRARCQDEGIPPFVCPNCGKISLGLTMTGRKRKACPDFTCIGKALGKQTTSRGLGGYHKIDDKQARAIQADYSAGTGGYRLLAKIHNVSPASIRDLVKGATHREGVRHDG